MRQELVQTVEKSPGIHFRAVTREMGCSPSTVDYHFDRTDQLKDRDIRGYRRFYPVEVSEEYYSSLAALNHPVRSKIIYSIQEKDMRGFSDIKKVVDLSKSTISSHISVLTEADLLEVDEQGNRKYYDTSDPVQKAFNRFETLSLRKMESNFIDMWE